MVRSVSRLPGHFGRVNCLSRYGGTSQSWALLGPTCGCSCYHVALAIVSKEDASPMARGVTPRRPARSGRHEKVRVATGTLSRPSRGKASANAGGRKRPATQPRKNAANSPAATKRKKAARQSGKTPTYNPVAPDRIAEILKRLDQLYP